MKLILLSLLSMLITVSASAQNPNYDSTLAKSLGGNDMGMKQYILVMLKTGINKTTDKKFIDSCFAGHMSNMGVMVKNNQLVVAGPLKKNDKTYRGIFILNMTDPEKALELLQSDPAIKAQLLEPEIYQWWGSAALPVYLEAAEKIRK